MRLSAALLLLLSGALSADAVAAAAAAAEPEDYGVDRTWPIHHEWTDSSAILSDERMKAYGNFMSGCAETFGADVCNTNERDRVELNRIKPQSMVVSEE